MINKMNKLVNSIASLNPDGLCFPAIEWLESEKIQTLEEAWENCPWADWMLWLCIHMLDKPGWPTHDELTAIGRWCASTVLNLWAAPLIVKAYLKTGEKSIRRAAYSATIDAYFKPGSTAEVCAMDAALDAADGFIGRAARNAARAYAFSLPINSLDKMDFNPGVKKHHKLMCSYIRDTLSIGELP